MNVLLVWLSFVVVVIANVDSTHTDYSAVIRLILVHSSAQIKAHNRAVSFSIVFSPNLRWLSAFCARKRKRLRIYQMVLNSLKLSEMMFLSSLINLNCLPASEWQKKNTKHRSLWMPSLIYNNQLKRPEQRRTSFKSFLAWCERDRQRQREIEREKLRSRAFNVTEIVDNNEKVYYFQKFVYRLKSSFRNKHWNCLFLSMINAHFQCKLDAVACWLICGLS